mmetsp:Transcript_58449/g.163750  ORF Transcript_58449/g.163750 Transcript_58449/m.163750 type:complete len:347 (+) Transcript_58449:152-1192(+)
MARGACFASALCCCWAVLRARRLSGVDEVGHLGSSSARVAWARASDLEVPKGGSGVSRRDEDAGGFLDLALGVEGPEDDAGYSFEYPETVISRKTVWLIRHGQAVHNIEEERATRRAAKEARSAGFDPSSEEFTEHVAAARKAALSNVHLLDAPLSQQGKEQVEAARTIIQELILDRGLPMPTSVLTSPLQRTLQTTAIIFPDHPGVHMRECLRERRTGLPCDERQPAMAIHKRESFAFMSSMNLVALEREGLGDHGEQEETKPKLRSRTLQIIDELLRFPDNSICIVTHKGCLRELERGPLERPGATEFRNCEVRAYDIVMLASGQIKASLIYAGDDPAGAAAEP